MTDIVPWDAAGIGRAAELIRDCHIVAVPTETVYGLAGRADQGVAVSRIYAAKGRPSFNPLIVHIADMAQAEAIAEFDSVARTLAQHFWPGPLTLVLPLKPGAAIASLTTAGLSTVAIRMPAHPAMRALLEAAAVPLAAPSANASGSISPTRAEHVRRSLQGRVPLIIDAGPTMVGLESTIVAIGEQALTLLRPGPVTAEDLHRVTGRSVIEGKAEDGIIAPGQLASHYAPSKPLRLHARSAKEGEWLIGFGDIAGDATLSETGDLTEAAARLFDLLHAADQSSCTAIAIASIPDTGLGIAINDRLNRAAVPRPISART